MRPLRPSTGIWKPTGRSTGRAFHPKAVDDSMALSHTGFMSEHTQYYEAFRTNYWATTDAATCRCHGSGWALSEVDTWHKCPVHFVPGTPHPDEAEYLDGLAEAPVAGDLEGYAATYRLPEALPMTEDDIPF